MANRKVQEVLAKQEIATSDRAAAHAESLQKKIDRLTLTHPTLARSPEILALAEEIHALNRELKTTPQSS